MILPVAVSTFLAELLQGVHQPDDTYKVALYTDTGHLSEDCGSYTDAHECQAGSSYQRGGLTLSGRTVRQAGRTAILTWGDAVWPIGSIGPATGALIYNASRENRAVAVIVFDEPRSSRNGPFILEFPDPRQSEGVVALTA